MLIDPWLVVHGCESVSFFVSYWVGEGGGEVMDAGGSNNTQRSIDDKIQHRLRSRLMTLPTTRAPLL